MRMPRTRRKPPRYHPGPGPHPTSMYASAAIRRELGSLSGSLHDSSALAGVYPRAWTCRISTAFKAAGPWVLRTRQMLERGLLAALNAARLDLAPTEILDVGTGGRPFLNVFIGLGATPARCHGIDLVPERIEIARERLQASVMLQVADAIDLPYADATFDLVSQFTYLCNLPDPRPAATEMRRVLRPGGHIMWFYIAHAPSTPITRPIPNPVSLFPGPQVLRDRMQLHPSASCSPGVRPCPSCSSCCRWRRRIE
jgi:SAM-dependent methyltransferase